MFKDWHRHLLSSTTGIGYIYRILTHIRTCLAVLPNFCKSFLKLLPLAPHPQHLSNFKDAENPDSWLVIMFLVSSQQVNSSRIDTQCLHSDRKGEVRDHDARFGHFLDQPDKIKPYHAKDLSSKKKNC